MALARAFAKTLPRPKRSLLFVWHTGEERGLWGSRYFVDYPTVPMDAVVAQLNIDMIGRNRDNRPSEANTVYVVGSDRISTELHDLNRTANASLPEPLTLNYELNDPTDPEQLCSAAIITVMQRGACRSSSSRRVSIRTTMPIPTRCPR
jgi:hypothetical protein